MTEFNGWGREETAPFIILCLFFLPKETFNQDEFSNLLKEFDLIIMIKCKQNSFENVLLTLEFLSRNFNSTPKIDPFYLEHQLWATFLFLTDISISKQISTQSDSIE